AKIASRAVISRYIAPIGTRVPPYPDIEDPDPMRKFLLVAVVALAVILPGAARADGSGLIGGAVLGGLVGSVYASGLTATAGAVGSAAASTFSAIGAAAPTVAAGLAGAIAAASTPVLVGVVAGGLLGYLLL